jgi:exodeoxyribonuclease-3
VQLVTWNVNSLKARLDRVLAWLEVHQPDVVCLQETKLADDAFPALAFQALGYDSAHHGQGQWNGVALLSRVGLDDVNLGFDDADEPDPEARVIWATCDGVRVASVYVPNGRAVDHDHYQYKLAWLERLRAGLEAHDPSRPLVVSGDFNIAPHDDDVWDITAFDGATHVTPAERAALQGLLDWGTVDVFRRLHPEGGTFSWWDYRGGDFHKGKGMRIDLVLATEVLAATCTEIVVDRNERKKTGNPAGGAPSDHAPVVATFRR